MSIPRDRFSGGAHNPPLFSLARLAHSGQMVIIFDLGCVQPFFCFPSYEVVCFFFFDLFRLVVFLVFFLFLLYQAITVPPLPPLFSLCFFSPFPRPPVPCFVGLLPSPMSGSLFLLFHCFFGPPLLPTPSKSGFTPLLDASGVHLAPAFSLLLFVP